MIPQITEINFPSYATLNSATITLSEMGDRNITTQIKIDGDIVPDFSGWELEFKGERFILPVKEPQAAKDNTSRRSIVDLTFSSWAVQEMKRYFFVEMTSIESGTAIADKYKASLGLNIENFVTAFNNVLNYYFNGNIEMDLFGSGTGIYSAEPAFFEIDYTHIWDVLQKIYEIYEVRWTITYDSISEKYIIKVGYPAAEIDDHEFEYGYKGGLLRFERQVQDYDITNVLLGRGGEKNLPYRYFKKVDPQNPNWAGDPDAIPELKNIYFENLRDINFRRYVQGWKTNPNRILEEGDVVETYDSARGETDFAYAKGHTDEKFNPVEYVKDDASIAIYGERWGALDNADDIYPTIQGIEVDPYGRIDQVVDVEDVTTDDIEAMAADAAEITNVAGVSRTEWINANSTLTLDINGTDFIVPEGKVGNLTFVHTWFDTISYGKRGNDQVNIDPSDAVNELVGINTTLSYVTVVNRSTGTEYPPAGIPAGNYFYKLHIVVKSEFEPSMYNSVEVTVGVDGLKLTTSEGNANAWKPTFDIWVKNIWNTTQESGESDEQYAARVWEPILGDRTGEEAKIAFSTGFLSLSEDYNFTIASIPVVDRTKTIDGVASEWRITLIKSDAEYEATGKYIPNAETGGNASAGDYFFFTGIDMPWAYVLWAEEKLNAYKTAELAKLKQINPTWIIRIDKVRANTKEQGELEYLADRFASGAKLRVKDKRFTNGQVLTLYVQTVTYTWQEPSNGNPYLVPDIEVVLSDKVETVASPIDQLEGSVDLIQSTYAKISDIESAIRRVASPIFLKKTGESERSLSPTRFSSLMASESFRQGDIGGQGWGAYTDGEGHSVLEADTIVVRKDMRVNTLTVNQIAYLGGKQIISAAAMECNRVEVVDGGYKCYFDQKQGSVANLFKVDDVVLGQVWNADESELRYYKRKVIAIDSDSITLSSTIADGTGIPQPKDVLVQYGSYSDTSRQYVIVRDVIGGGYERMLSGLATVFSNGEEYYFAGRQDGSTPRWFVGDANGQHASYQDGVLNITGRLSVTTQVDKGNGTYESLSNYLSNLQDQIDGNIQTWYATGEPTLQNYPANTWPTVEDKNNHIGDLYYESETGKAYRFMLDGNTYKWVQIADEDIAAALALAQQNQTAIAGLAYLKAATNQGTLVQGGLVLTSMIQLGQTEEGVYKVYSGINGIMDTSALGNGIAAWYGGPMADIGADSTLTDFAKSLFRFDGSGYLASGNIKWDLNGNGEIPGISWNNGRITLSPDIYLQGGDRLTQIVDAVNRMYTQFAYDSHDNITVAPTHALYIPTTSPAYPIEGKVALYYDYNGNYSELPSGGVGEVFELTLRNGATLLGIFQPGVEDKTIDLAPMLSGYATQSWVSANFNKYVLPTASASVLGGIKIGTGLTIDATGVVSVTGQTQGTVTRVDLGTTQYSPNDSGVVTLPSYPTTLPASDVSAWAKKTSLEASDVPTLAISKISGLQDALDGKQPLDADLTAIAALTGSGLLRRNSNNTWSLDTNTYLTSSDHKALTLKVGTITIRSDFNSLAAKTYTITQANITDTIGTTTYAPYHADGYLPLSGGTLTGTLYTQHVLPSSALGGYNIGSETAPFGSGYFSGSLLAEESVETYDVIAHGTADLSVRLAIPTSAPTSPASGKTYLWASSLGDYAETPSGGGSATVYDLTIRKNGTAIGTYNLGTQAADVNIPVGWGDLTENSAHRFLTDTMINTWNAKQDAISDLATIRSNASTAATAVDVQQGSGLGIDSNGHLTLDSHDAADVLALGSAAFKGYDTAVTSGSANLVTSGAVYTAVSAKYTKPSTGIPKTDLASAVQTTLTNADTAYGWGNHANAGYLTSFTETDPTVPSWAKASTKPTYTLDEVADGSTRKLANYLPLTAGSGKALTGGLYIDSNAIGRAAHIHFNRADWSYFETVAGGEFAFTIDGASSIIDGVTLAISSTRVYPGHTQGTISLGDSSYYWKSVYSNAFIKSGGTASQVLKANGSVSNFASVGSTTMPVYFNASGNPAAISSLPEAYLSWGGKNFSAGYGPIDAALVGNLGANRFAFGKAEGIEVEYSRDNGTTWIDYGATDEQKVTFISGQQGGFTIGKAASGDVANANYQLRIRISTTIYLYTVLNKFIMYVGTNGTTGNWCTIRARYKSDQTADIDNWHVFAEKVGIAGWSGWNVLNTSNITFGNGSQQYGQIEFLFGCTGYNGNGTTNAGLAIYRLFAFGGQGWTTPSKMAEYGHLYNYNWKQDMILPSDLLPIGNLDKNIGDTSHYWKNIYASKFIVKNGTSSQFLKADGSLDSNAYALSSALDSYLPLSAGSGKALTGDLYLDASSTQKYVKAHFATSTDIPLIRASATQSGNKNGRLYFGDGHSFETYFLGGLKVYLGTSDASDASKLIVMDSSGNFYPYTNNTQILGLVNNKWKALYTSAADIAGNASITGNLVFDASAADKNIYYKASDNANYRALLMSTNGSLTVGYDNPARSKNTNVDGYDINLRFGSTKQYNLALHNTNFIGTNVGLIRPNADNETKLGHASYRWSDFYTVSADITDKLAVPTTAPTSPSSSKTYLWVDDDGNYSEMPLAKFNQLVQNGDFSTNSNWVRAYSGQSFAIANNTLTITCTAAINAPMVYQDLNIANGHKVFYSYYIKVNTAKNLTDLRPLMLYPSSQYPDENITSASLANWTRFTGVATATSAKTRIYLGTYNRYSTSKFAIGDTIQLRNVWFTDLTEAYGAGNEPTAEQFQAAYPADYYDYQPIGS